MPKLKGVRNCYWLFGDKNPAKRPEVREKIRMGLLGKKLSEAHKQKLKMANIGRVGEKAAHWKGGISKVKNYHQKKYREWIEKNRDYKNWLSQQRRVARLNADGSHTYGEWELLKKQYGYTCPACKKSEPEITLTEDHTIPLSKGGSDCIENIQPLCRSCNCKKHTKTVRYKNNNL